MGVLRKEVEGIRDAYGDGVGPSEKECGTLIDELGVGKAFGGIVREVGFYL